MNNKHSICFLIIAALGGYGFGESLAPVMNHIFHGNHYSVVFCAALFVVFTLWLLHDIQKEIKNRDNERAAIEKHIRHKRSVILSNHPLYESPEDQNGIRSMDQLGYYFDRYEDDVADMDWDSSGHHIFKDHRYFR